MDISHLLNPTPAESPLSSLLLPTPKNFLPVHAPSESEYLLKKRVALLVFRAFPDLHMNITRALWDEDADMAVLQAGLWYLLLLYKQGRFIIWGVDDFPIPVAQEELEIYYEDQSIVAAVDGKVVLLAALDPYSNNFVLQFFWTQ